MTCKTNVFFVYNQFVTVLATLSFSVVLFIILHKEMKVRILYLVATVNDYRNADNETVCDWFVSFYSHLLVFLPKTILRTLEALNEKLTEISVKVFKKMQYSCQREEGFNFVVRNFVVGSFVVLASLENFVVRNIVVGNFVVLIRVSSVHKKVI